MNSPNPTPRSLGTTPTDGVGLGHAVPWWLIGVVGVVYFGAAELGSNFWIVTRHAPAFGASLGVYLAAVLLLRGRWLAIAAVCLLGAISSQGWLHGVSLVLSLSYFALQSSSVFLIATVLRRVGGIPYRLESLRAVMIYGGVTMAVLAGLLAPIAAVVNEWLFRVPKLHSWIHWLLATLAGIWLVTPPLLALGKRAGQRVPWHWGRIFEAALLFSSVCVAALATFSNGTSIIAIPTVQLLWAVWAVLRFGSAGVGVTLLILTLADLIATTQGLGPFSRAPRSIEESILRMLTYTSLWGLFFQIVGAILTERTQAVLALAALNRELEARVAERTESLSEAGERLLRSESRLALAVRAAHSGVFDWESSTNINHWSDELLALYGLRREEFGNKIEDWLEALVPEDRESGHQAVRQALLTGQFIAQFRIKRRDNGEIRWMDGRGTVVFDSQGTPLRMLGINIDVTEQKLAELEMKLTAARKAALLELSRTILLKPATLVSLGEVVYRKIAPVLKADIGFNFQFFPKEGKLKLVTALGVPAEFNDVVQELELNQAFCGTVAATGQPLMADTQCIITNPRGALVHKMGVKAYACHPLLASDGRLLGTLSFGSRERERFTAEEVDFLQTLCHFVSMAWERFGAEAAVHEAKEAAERASRAKDDFLAALSHELRTPLNPVLLLSSEMEGRRDLPEEVLSDLAIIRRNIELEARLIDDLLDLTRITRGKVGLELRPLAVHRVIQDALSILQGDIEGKELDLVLELHEGNPTVLGDPVRLQQVFWNVLRNAIKFTYGGGRVTVRTSVQEGRFRIEVVDTGVGIKAAYLEKIFETFHQAEGGHRFGGLGLGLAIARSLVEMHGGKIEASSAGAGHGSTFRIELPLAAASEQVISAEPATPRIALTAAMGLRILLVEDHEPTRQVLTRLLERRRHSVFVAENLAVARQFASTESFDLLISDLGLPDGDGTDLMRHLVSTGGPPGIAISGYGMDDDLARSSGAGFFAHLVKPVDIGILDRTMAALADSGAMLRRQN